MKTFVVVLENKVKVVLKATNYLRVDDRIVFQDQVTGAGAPIIAEFIAARVFGIVQASYVVGS